MQGVKVTRWGLLSYWDACRRSLPWPGRLLIVGPKGLGDAIAALPTLRLLQRAAPQTQLTWLSNASHEPLVSMMGVRHFLPEVPSSTVSPPDPATFDAVMAFHDVPVEGPGGMDLSKIPVRIGSASGAVLPRWCNHLVYTKRIGEPRHEILRNLRLLIPFGLRQRPGWAELGPLVELNPARLALPIDLPAAHYVVLHPFSAGSAREWPIAHWRELAVRLVAKGQQVVLTGSASERDRLAEAWPPASRPAQVHDAAGRLNLAELASLLQGADTVVAASTGPLHLAAALGAPTLGLFVPRKGLGLDRWAPLGRRAAGLQVHAHCPKPRHCAAPSCACMAALAPAVVASAVATSPDQCPPLSALPPSLLRSHPGTSV